MLRGWLRERALFARHRLSGILIIIAMQTLFDAMVPQVSMTAHLSGAFLGFAATIALRDRLRVPTQPPPLPESAPATSSGGAEQT